MNTNLDKLSAADFRRLADIRENIEQLEGELAQILSGKKKPGRKPGAKKPGPKPGPKKKAKRKMSQAGRDAIRLAQKKRWAKVKKKTAKKKG